MSRPRVVMWRVRAQHKTYTKWETVFDLTRSRCAALAYAYFWWFFHGAEWEAVVVESRHMGRVPCDKCGRYHWVEPYPNDWVCPRCR